MSDRQFPQIILGVERSATGQAALRVAVAEAIRRDVPLHAVSVRPHIFVPVDDFTQIYRAFDEALGGIPEGVDIRPAILDTPVAAALTGRAHHPGDLLVLGAGRQGATSWWRRLWSRSVVRSCLRTARCPVMVVSSSGFEL